jgi:outer membrane protein assembly factor BamB
MIYDMRILLLFVLLSAARLSAAEPTVLWQFDIKDNAFGQSAAADLDGDGKLEVVFSTYMNDGNIYVLNAEDGSLLWKYDVEGCADAAPLISDLDGDGQPEIVLHISCLAYMYCFNGADGSVKWKVTSRGTDSPPSAADIDGDGIKEIFDGDFRGYLSCFNSTDGSVIWEKLVEDGFFLQTAPLLYDIDGDEELEIIGATYYLDSLCSVYAYEAKDGSLIWNSAHIMNAVYHAPSIADIDGDGSAEIFLSDFDGVLYCLNAQDGTLKWNYTYPGGTYAMAPTAIADINNDNLYEVIYFCNDVICAMSGDGELLWDHKISGGLSLFRGGITVDVNGDDYLDVVCGDYSGTLTAVSGLDGSLIWNMDIGELYGRDFNLQHGIIASDFDGDETLDLFIVGGWNHYPDTENNYGRAYMISTGSKSGTDWLMFQNNEKRNSFVEKTNTGVFEIDGDIIQIYPNPASDYIDIRLDAVILSEAKNLKFFNALGECVLTPLAFGEGTGVRLDISLLQPGVYFIKVGDKVYKFIKM